MNFTQAKKLAQYHSFTKKELFEILKEALSKMPKSFWSKPYISNGIMDNGYAFNDRVKWLDYKEGVNDNDYCHEIIVIRILEMFGKFSNVQLPKKTTKKIDIKMSSQPVL